MIDFGMKRFWAIPLTVIALCLGFTSFANAKVIITERTKFYTVTGKTGPQMFRSITRRGPKTRRDGHAIATTRTEIKFRNLKIGVKGRRCVVENFDLVLKLTYTLPRWRGSRKASPKLRKTWDLFYAKVKKHEDTHGRISREYARKLHDRIRKLTGRVSNGCKNFGKKTRSLRLAQREFARRHAAFDRREGRASSRIRRLQRAVLVAP